MYIGFLFTISLFTFAFLLTVSWIKFHKKTEGNKFGGSVYAFALASNFVFALWLGSWLLMPFLYNSTNEAGPAGDMFGAATSLFSGLAFAGLISTLLMQRQELELQRGELKETREEFARQRFENTLFSIVGLFVSHTNVLEYGGGDEPLRGRAVLEYFASELQDEWVSDLLETENGEEYILRRLSHTLEEQIEKYEDVYNLLLEADLGPYFRLLYNAIRHIEKSSISEDEKLRYSKIVRAHLSSAEVKLLMFNCLSKKGQGFKNWVEKHSLLKHASPNARDGNPMIVAGYSALAFGTGAD